MKRAIPKLNRVEPRITNASLALTAAVKKREIPIRKTTMPREKNLASPTTMTSMAGRSPSRNLQECNIMSHGAPRTMTLPLWAKIP
jgi:hypothetical protein